MGKRDARLDAYIAEAGDFAKPVLRHLRDLVHQACPEVEEDLKWSHPSFMYKGILCGVAAFNAHCTFGFWKHSLLFADDKMAQKRAEEAMGSFGRITSLADLPADKLLISYIKEAKRLNDLGVKTPRPKPKPRTELVVPEYLIAALKKSPKARAAFENFSYSHQKEYVEWLTEAKREETRDQRLATTIQWLSEGKPRNWKYMNC